MPLRGVVVVVVGGGGGGGVNQNHASDLSATVNTRNSFTFAGS